MEESNEEQTVNDVITYKGDKILQLVAENSSGSIEALSILMYCKLQLETKIELDIAEDILRQQEIRKQMQ